MHRQHPHRHCGGDAGAVGPGEAGPWRGRGQQNAARQGATAAAEDRCFEESQAEAQKGPGRTWRPRMLGLYSHDNYGNYGYIPLAKLGKLEVNLSI